MQTTTSPKAVTVTMRAVRTCFTGNRIYSKGDVFEATPGAATELARSGQATTIGGAGPSAAPSWLLPDPDAPPAPAELVPPIDRDGPPVRIVCVKVGRAFSADGREVSGASLVGARVMSLGESMVCCEREAIGHVYGGLAALAEDAAISPRGLRYFEDLVVYRGQSEGSRPVATGVIFPKY